jgi:hypothetical protein
MVTAIYDGTAFQMISPVYAPASSLDFTLALGHSAVLANPGYTTAHDPTIVSATLVSGFAAVALSVSGLPPGVSYDISPGGGFPTFSATLIFDLDENVTPGSYSIVITGEGGGSIETANLQLNIYDVKRVFVSAGDVPANAIAANADNVCNSEATGAGLPGTYRAWVSDGSSNHVASTTMTSYRRVDGQVVAWDWTDLIDGALMYPINLTTVGSEFSGTVWTGLQNDGTVASANCNNWTSGSTSVQGAMGYSGSVSGWSNQQNGNCGLEPQYIAETLNPANCTACGGATATLMWYCGNGCSGTFLNSNCELIPASSPNSNFYQCFTAASVIGRKVYCFEE